MSDQMKKNERDNAAFATGEFASLVHASDYRRARHVAWQRYYREAKRLRRAIAANEQAITAGHGLLLDLPGGIREAQHRLRTAAQHRERYIATYGSAS